METIMKLALVAALVALAFLLGRDSAEDCGGCNCGKKWAEQTELNGQYNRHIIQSGGRIISPNPAVGAANPSK